MEYDYSPMPLYQCQSSKADVEVRESMSKYIHEFYIVVSICPYVRRHTDLDNIC